MTQHHHENDPKYQGLNVSRGVERPPTINPYLKAKKRQRKLTVDEYVAT